MPDSDQERPEAAVDEQDASPEVPTPEEEVAASSAADEPAPAADVAPPVDEGVSVEAAAEASDAAATDRETTPGEGSPVDETEDLPGGEGAETAEVVAQGEPEPVADDPGAPHAPQAAAAAETESGVTAVESPEAESPEAESPPGDDTAPALAEPPAAPDAEGAGEAPSADDPSAVPEPPATPEAVDSEIEGQAAVAEPTAGQTAPEAAAPAGDAIAETATTAEAGSEAPETAADATAEGGPAPPETAASAEKGAPPAAAAPRQREGDPRFAALRRAREKGEVVEGKVFGWNQGGFHVVVGDVPAFCPRSEMELGEPRDPDSYLDQTFSFRVLRVQSKAKRVVLSRLSVLRGERDASRAEVLQRLQEGAVLQGTVSNLTDFGAFVDLGTGIEGLVHVSEISQQRVERPGDALQVGQQVEVKVLKVEKRSKRISLSIKALQPDPWQGVKQRFPEGALVTGRVERTAKPGAFIELEPGLTGLLPTSEMNLPREALPARIYPPGKEVRVLVMQVDPRRRRIALALEGSAVEGTRQDYMKHREAESEPLGTLAAAFQKLRSKG